MLEHGAKYARICMSIEQQNTYIFTNDVYSNTLYARSVRQATAEKKITSTNSGNMRRELHRVNI